MISIVTPAHNEADFLNECVVSVKRAAAFANIDFEHIVVINRCTDETEEIAREGDCVIAHEEARNISKIRNAGAAVARGETIVTVDADSFLSENALAEVVRLLETEKFIGGGTVTIPDRWSLGILCSLMVAMPFILWQRTSAGMFWCRREAFEAIGGFDESIYCAEDLDFAHRLTKYGKENGLRYGTIFRGWILTSCRKFDLFGDWYFVRNPSVVVGIFARDKKVADAFYYDARSDRD